MNNYSTEQLQKIVDDAHKAEGVEYFLAETQMYFKSKNPLLYWNRRKSIWEKCDWGNIERAADFHSEPYIKLSDIRAELLARQFKVGDRVVKKTGYIDVFEIEEIEDGMVSGCTGRGAVEFRIDECRHATAEEEIVGHRIDEPAKMMTRESLLPPLRNTPVTFLNDAQIDELAKRMNFSSEGYVQLKPEQKILPAIITAQLDPAKCHKVDPTVYDAPFINPSLSDEPWQNPDAMSESHRSPSCKCHEFPFDAELVPDAVNQNSKAAKKIKKLKKRIARLEKDRQFSELKAKDWAHKYWDSFIENTGLYCALQEVFAERAAEYEAEIERLKGEQGE